MVDCFEGKKLKTEFEIPVRHPSRNIKQAVENESITFRIEVWTRNRNLETINVEMVFIIHGSRKEHSAFCLKGKRGRTSKATFLNLISQ